MNTLKRGFCIGSFVAILVMGGCGGGGGGGGNGNNNGGNQGGNSNGGTLTTTYLLYQGSIDAVDPAAPASPITVEAGTVARDDLVGAIYAGTYNASTKTITDGHQYAAVYAKDDGKLYRVSVLKSSGTPVPVQLSNESSADKECRSDTGEDYADPNKSQYIYELPGADNDCSTTGDNVWKMVRLDMSSTDASVSAKETITSINSLTTGTLSYWLVIDGSDVKRCDASFGTCGSSLKTIASSVTDEIDSGKYHLLNIDDTIYVYDDVTNTLSSSVYAGAINDSVSDGTYFFFSTGTRVYRAPIDGSAPATVLYADTDNITSLGLTTNKVVYTTLSALNSLAKTPGSPTPLVSAVSGGGMYPFTFIGGAHIYYTTFDSSFIPTAGKIDDDGSNKSESTSSQWVGATFSTTQDITFGVGSIDRVFRAEGWDTTNGFSNGTIKSIKAETGASEISLGTLPSEFYNIDCNGLGDNILCNAGNKAFTNTDIIFINASTAASLQRVTATSAKFEFPIF